MNTQLQTILGHYDLGVVNNTRPISSGYINSTFFVETSSGNYVLQKMGEIFNEHTVEDMAKVTEHLKAKGLVIPELIRTTSDEILVHDDANHVWRLMTAIDGDTFETLESEVLAEEAGRALAEFHLGMQDFDASQLNSPIKLHQTKAVLDKYMEVHEQLLTEETDDAMKNVYERIAKELPEVLLPEGLPTTVVHGDPKISNIIFKDDKAVCMIDLDTCMEHTPLVDLGDALWSWCGLEDDNPNNRFSLAKFEAAMKGYMSVIPLSTDEQHYVYRGMRLIMLELASRFSRDIIDDNYFGWDDSRYPNRKAHNKARALSMIALEMDTTSKRDRIIDILNNL